MDDPYKILGLEKDASESDIKKAYRKLAMKHHPDKGGKADEFKKVSSAYEILSDKDKKNKFDTFGTMDMGMEFDPMDIFKTFERDFFGPNNIGGPFFGGFTVPQSQSNQFNGLNMFLGGIGGIGGIGGMDCFSQTTVIRNGKKVTTTTQNGKTTIIEEILSNRLN